VTKEIENLKMVVAGVKGRKRWMPKKRRKRMVAKRKKRFGTTNRCKQCGAWKNKLSRK
jgi:hypothetical protein